MPASDKVPSPLKFLGYIPGEPGKLTYHKDIVRYLEALDKASDRVTLMKIGKTEEGRDMVALAIADEATIKNLDKYKADHRAADRSAQAARTRRRSSSSRPASRSTTRWAASTRRRPAAPRC